MRQVLRAGALGRPRGMGWRGRWEEGLVKNSEAVSQRHAAGLSKEEVAPPEGDDS